MPRFEEYIAKGKLTPSDQGFTAFETAARRQQSFTADQTAAIEKSSKAVGEAWTGGLKFGLDEIEMQQAKDKGGGGVKVENGGKVSRTLIGTGANSGVTHNEVSRGISRLAQTARGLNNQVTPPVTAKDGITQDPDSGVVIMRGGSDQRITQLPVNPQNIPMGPGDANFQALIRFGINPAKQITIEPLPAPAVIPEGQEGVINQPRRLPEGDPNAPPPEDLGTPFPKSGMHVWERIRQGLGLPQDPTHGVTGTLADAPHNVPPVADDKNTMKPTGTDDQGIPFYGTTDQSSPKEKGGTITPIPQDTGVPPDTTTTLPAPTSDDDTTDRGL